MERGTSLEVQWLRLQAPNAGSPSLIPGQGTRSHVPQLRVHMLQLTPTQPNKYIKKQVYKQKEFLIVFIESVEMFLQFCVSVFWLRSIRDLAPQLGVKPAPPALEGRVSTIAP